MGWVMTRGRTGMTIVEVVVVIVILAIATGVIAPRLMTVGRDSALPAAERTRDLLSQAARRERFGNQQLMLAHDATRMTLSLRVRDQDENAAGEGAWRTDVLSAPVDVSRVVMEKVEAGTAVLPTGDWTLPLSGGEGRPAISITLLDGRTGARYVVELGGQAISAAVRKPEEATTDRSIDLDSRGLREDPW